MLRLGHVETGDGQGNAGVAHGGCDGQCRALVFVGPAQRIAGRSVSAIKAGASDFLCKPVEYQTLLAAIETALAVGATTPNDAVPGDTVGAALSAREIVVLRGIVGGRLNKQIAADLALSERTIKTCRAELMRKLGARSLAALLQLAPSVLPTL